MICPKCHGPDARTWRQIGVDAVGCMNCNMGPMNVNAPEIFEAQDPQKAENTKLWEIIRDAPHEDWCKMGQTYFWPDTDETCNCWKLEVANYWRERHPS